MKTRKILFFMILSLVFCTSSAIFIKKDADAKQLNSISDAKKAAKKQVPSAQITEVELDTDHGVSVYDVSMFKNTKEYNLKFRISDGALLAYDWELPNTSYSIQNKANLSKTKIRKKVLKLVKKATISSLRLVIDDGLSEYKVVLKKGNRQYKLVYNAKNGKLLEYEWKLVSSRSSSASNKNISMQKAQNIALKKVPGATVAKIELDRDDGMSVYEIELRKGAMEYDIEMDAKSGKILKFESEYDD